MCPIFVKLTLDRQKEMLDIQNAIKKYGEEHVSKNWKSEFIPLF